MNRRVLIAATITAVSLMWAAQANAAAKNTPLSLSLGVNFPNQANAQAVGGNTQIAVNTSYSLTPTNRHLGSLYVFVDYTGGGKNGASENTIGGGVGFRLNTPIYGGLDLGAYGTGVNVPVEGVTLTSSTTGGGGRVYIGGNLISGAPVVYLEGGYRFLPSVSGVDPSGWGVSLGARF